MFELIDLLMQLFNQGFVFLYLFFQHLRNDRETLLLVFRDGMFILPSLLMEELTGFDATLFQIIQKILKPFLFWCVVHYINPDFDLRINSSRSLLSFGI